MRIIGDLSKLSVGMQKSIQNCMERTKDNTGIVFNIAINYGGRDELLKATKQIATQVEQGILAVEDITEETIESQLYTAGQPDPDLVIRTSGEKRTSNFLPWQIVYTEFLFIDKKWPDFTEQDLDEAIRIYQKRKRNFGAQ